MVKPRIWHGAMVEIVGYGDYGMKQNWDRIA